MSHDWQAPDAAVTELILMACRWFPSWRGTKDNRRGQDWWIGHLQIAAQWRAAAVLSSVSSGWQAAVRAWQAHTQVLRPYLVLWSPAAPTDVIGNSVFLGAALQAAWRSVSLRVPALTAVDFNHDPISDATLIELAQRCPCIRKVCTGYQPFGGDALSSTGFFALARCQELRELDLTRLHSMERVSTEALASLGTISLTRLNLTGATSWLTDEGVQALAACKSLTELYLSTSSGLRDHGLCAIAASCRQLRVLDVSNCTRITETSMHALAALPLRDLELASCVKVVTDAALCSWCQRGECHITRLGLNRCTAFSAPAMIEFTAICPRLLRLSMAHCPSTTDAVLEALARHCPGLLEMDVSYCEDVSDAGVTTLVEGCCELERLYMDGCGDALTDDFAAALARLLPPRLELVSARHCDGALSPKAFLALEEALPELELRDLSGPGIAPRLVKLTASAMLAFAQRTYGL